MRLLCCARRRSWQFDCQEQTYFDVYNIRSIGHNSKNALNKSNRNNTRQKNMTRLSLNVT